MITGAEIDDSRQRAALVEAARRLVSATGEDRAPLVAATDLKTATRLAGQAAGLS